MSGSMDIASAEDVTLEATAEIDIQQPFVSFSG